MEINRSNEENKHGGGRDFQSMPKQEPKTDSFTGAEKKKETVLILEDDERIIKLYKRVFTDFSLVIAASIKEGEEKLSELRSQGINPDVFITDYHLPDGTSEKFVSSVKEAFPKIKVILCSSDDSAESVIKPDVSFSKGSVFEIKSKIEEFLKDGSQ